MADHLEIEQKFDADQDFERPDLAAVAPGVTAAAPVAHHLSATYYDTADGRLHGAKITLRRRTGGSDAGWHLKLPGTPLPGDPPLPDGVSARREVREPLDGAGTDAAGAHVVPARLSSRVADVTGGLPLAPIAVLRTERTVVTLSGPDGTVLAEIADDQVTASRLPEAPSGPLRWRELEVEVPSAVPDLQRAVAGRLLAAGARPAGHASKLGRLLSA
jgi:inorganic triphosphatase YgiF